MKSIYEYLYYKLFWWSVWVNGENYYNAFSASIMISVPTVLNIITIQMLADIILRLDWLVSPVPMGIVVAAACGLFNYSYFVAKGRYVHLLHKYSGENDKDRRLGSIWAGVYVVGSFFLMMAVGIVGVGMQ